MTRVCIVYHSARGHTKVLAEAVARGAGAVTGVYVASMAVDAVDWDALAAADAIVFGCPTFMGGPSAEMKAFMDASSRRAWATRAWKDKLAAGFTNSSAASGDKLSTLVALSIFAAQHDMIWVGLGLRPGNNTLRGSSEELNRLGSHLGAMAQSPIDASPDVAPIESDRKTAMHLGERVARAAVRWASGRAADVEPAGAHHPTTRSWVFPPSDRPPLALPRVSLRELEARAGRFEHHLMVVARIGGAQLEVATASEPLYFAHQNISDEYAVAMSTGDPLLETFPFLTLFSDPASLEDVGRVRHETGELVLHPFGLLHWPGRLRPPHDPFVFGPGERRTGYSLVYCASKLTPPSEARPLFVSAGSESDVKRYGAADVPFLLADTRTEPSRVLGIVGETRLELLVAPERIAPARGGYVVVLESSSPALFPGDLVHVPEGSTLEAAGVARALLFASDTVAPEPPPSTWVRVPDPPFAPFEDAPRGALPFAVGPLSFEESSAKHVRVSIAEARAEVPRYWLARMLFRIALHGYAMGYLETYGGLWWDDRAGDFRIGIRGGGHVAIGERELAQAIEQLYRAVAPDGYVERLF